MIVSIPVEIYRFFDIDDTQLTEFITSNHLDIEKDIEEIANEFGIPTDTIKARYELINQINDFYHNDRINIL